MTKEPSRARDLETLARSLAGRGWTVRLAPPGEDGAPALPHVAALTRVPRRTAYAVCVDDVGLAVWDAADTPRLVAVVRDAASAHEAMRGDVAARSGSLVLA